MSAGRDLVTQHRAAQHRIGVLALEVAPAHVADGRAMDVLAPVADDIGITTAELLACRRYALSGDVRAMDGW